MARWKIPTNVAVWAQAQKFVWKLLSLFFLEGHTSEKCEVGQKLEVYNIGEAEVLRVRFNGT